MRQLAVGSDGTLFLAGLASPNEVAWVAAYSDAGEPLWTTALDRDDTELVRGLALREEGGTTTRVLATTGRRASGERDGRLHALDPTDGSVVWTFDPEENGGRGAPSGISLDFDGTAYLSTHGAERRGSVYAVDADGPELWHFCRDEYEGAHPILTPSGHLVVGEADWLECAVTSPLSSTCRSSATDRVVRIYYADEDSAPLASQVAWPCCRCQAGLTPAGSAPLLALLLLVRRRRLR